MAIMGLLFLLSATMSRPLREFLGLGEPQNGRLKSILPVKFGDAQVDYLRRPIPSILS